jgi:hypothetical protein
MSRQPETLKFLRISQKPTLGTIERYFAKRLQPEPETSMFISGDFLGNTLVTSMEHTETTFTGLMPSSFIASPEGIHIIAQNPSLLKNISRGAIQRVGCTMGGLESNVYKIILQTDSGPKEHSLKYTFPVNEFGGCFTSGIAAMQLMQLAHKEKPIPYIGYTVPIIATHDITIAPFVSDGVDLFDFIESLRSSMLEWKLKQMLKTLSGHKRRMMFAMKQYEIEHLHDNTFSFTEQLSLAAKNQKNYLVSWVKKQTSLYSEFKFHRINTFDTSLNQTVVDIEGLYALFIEFHQNPTFNASHPEFMKQFLQSLSLIELGIGNQNNPS